MHPDRNVKKVDLGMLFYGKGGRDVKVVFTNGHFAQYPALMKHCSLSLRSAFSNKLLSPLSVQGRTIIFSFGTDKTAREENQTNKL